MAIYATLILILLIAGGEFQALSQRGTKLAALRVFVVMASLSMVSGLLFTLRTAPTDPLIDRVRETFFGLLGFAPELTFDHLEGASLTEIALTSLGALTALLTLAALLAPARQQSVLGDELVTSRISTWLAWLLWLSI